MNRGRPNCLEELSKSVESPSLPPVPVSAKIGDGAYDAPPWWYDIRGFFILTFSYRSTLPVQIRFFARNIRERHLEVAIGSGTLFSIIVRFLRWKGRVLPSTVGVDYSAPMLAGAVRRFKGQRFIRLYEGDVARLPELNASFGTVNIANAFHCFSDPGSALREVRRVLEPGGTLAMNVLLHPSGSGPLRWIAEAINRWGVRKGILYSSYCVQEVRKMLADAGFEVLKEEISGNSCMVLAKKRPEGF